MRCRHAAAGRGFDSAPHALPLPSVRRNHAPDPPTQARLWHWAQRRPTHARGKEPLRVCVTASKACAEPRRRRRAESQPGVAPACACQNSRARGAGRCLGEPRPQTPAGEGPAERSSREGPRSVREPRPPIRSHGRPQDLRIPSSQGRACRALGGREPRSASVVRRASQLGLLLVLPVSVLLGPGDDVGQAEHQQDVVLEGLEAAGVDVLSSGGGGVGGWLCGRGALLEAMTTPQAERGVLRARSPALLRMP